MRAVWPVLSAVAIAAAITGCASASADGEEPVAGPTATPTPAQAPLAEPFRDDFDDASSLDSWRVTQGQHSGGPAEVSVVDGELRVVSAHASWLNEVEAFGLARTVVGDVDVTARIRTTGTSGEHPGVAWSLAGLMLRDPAGGPADWIHWTVGAVNGPTLERKRTSTGRSILDLIELPDYSPIDLRLIRSGDHVMLAYRQHDDPWTVAYDYTWVEKRETMHLLITAQSGGESDHADLVAFTDFVEVVPAAYEADEVALLAERDASPLND